MCTCIYLCNNNNNATKLQVEYTEKQQHNCTSRSAAWIKIKKIFFAGLKDPEKHWPTFYVEVFERSEIVWVGCVHPTD